MGKYESNLNGLKVLYEPKINKLTITDLKTNTESVYYKEIPVIVTINK